MSGLQPRNSNRSAPFSAVAIVLLLLGAGMLLVPDEVASQGGGIAPLTITPNCAEVGKEQQNTFRDIGVAYSQSGAGVITQVRFEWEPLPGQSLQSIKHRLHWVFGELPGWDVTWQNKVLPFQLIFTSSDVNNPEFVMGPAEERIFRVFFSVIGKPQQGIVFPIAVHATYTDANGVQTQTINPSPYCLIVDSNPPVLLRARAFDCNGEPPYRVPHPVFPDQCGTIIRTQTYNKPYNPNLPWLNNGRIDRIELLFDELLDMRTFGPEDLLIGTTIDPYKIVGWQLGSEDVGVEFGSPCTDDEDSEDPSQFVILARCTRIIIFLEEKVRYDSGKMPSVKLSESATISDLAGNFMKGGSGVTLEDWAPPVMVGALTYHTGDFVEPKGSETYESTVLHFSEPVATYWGGNAQVITGNLRALDNDDLQIVDGPSGNAHATMTGATPTGTVTHGESDLSTGNPRFDRMYFRTTGASPNPPWLPSDVPKDITTTVGDRICYMVRDTAAIPNYQPGDPSTDTRVIQLAPGFMTGETADLELVGVPVGGVAPNGIFPNCRRIHTPDVIAAFANIDSDEVKLQFTGPVSAWPGNDPKNLNKNGGPVKPQHIDVVPTTVDNGCPGGTLGLTATSESDIVIVKMDDIACPTDVDDTPSFIRVAPSAVKASGALLSSQVGEPKQAGTGGDWPAYVPTQDIPMLDLAPPVIISAHTVDTDHNGAIDGFFLEFSERIDDAGFCNANPSCPISGGIVRVIMRNNPHLVDSLLVHSGLEPVSCQPSNAADPKAHAYTWDTDLTANDRFGILKWKIKNPEGNNPECVVPDPKYDRVGDHLVFVDTGSIPDLVTGNGVNFVPPNLFRDQVQRFNIPSPNPLQVTARNLMPGITTYDVHEKDGAAPQILDLETFEKETTDGATAGCRVSRPGTLVTPICRENGDGIIDGYRLVFSENMNDSTFTAASQNPDNGFFIGGKPVEAKLSTLKEEDFDNDEVVYVVYAPGNVPNTDATPQLTYAKLGAPVTVRDTRLNDPGVKDVHGIPLNSVTATDVSERDGARPVLVRVDSEEGSNVMVLTFSEAVDDGQAGSLIRDDLTYQNVANPDDPSVPNASGFNGNIEVKHVVAQTQATVTLNGPLTEDDQDADKIYAKEPISTPTICVQFPQGVVRPGNCSGQDNQGNSYNGFLIGKDFSCQALSPTSKVKPDCSDGDGFNGRVVAKCCVFESQPNLPKELRKYALNHPKSLLQAPDTIAPATVDDLQVDRITANSVRLFWTAAGDDGRDGRISNLTIKVATEPLPIGADQVKQFFAVPDDDNIEFEPTLAVTSYVQGNKTQEFLVTGLKPRSTYYFAVLSEDEVKNQALPSNMVSAETLEDITPPTGEVKISSSTHAVDSYTLKTTAKFTWTKAEDLDSTVLYHYKLNQNPVYSAVLGDQKTSALEATVEVPAHGEWYFHVRAFSGAGGQPSTAHYGPFNVGFDPISAQALRNINELLQESTFANITSRGVEVEWVIPSTGLPGEVEAVEVWKMQDGAWIRIHRESGTLADLRFGNFTDPGGQKSDRYLVTLVFKEGQSVKQPLPADYEGVAVKGKAPVEVPSWIWILLGVCLALIIAGLVIFFVLRQKSRREAEKRAEMAYQWEAASAGDAGIDPATGLPLHDVKCPVCATEFQAVGEFPLDVTCPNCNASGTID